MAEENGLLLQNVILELQISNENVSGIETGVTMLTDSTSSLLSSVEKNDQTVIGNDDRMLYMLQGIAMVNVKMLDTMNRLYKFFIDSDMIRAEQHRDLIDAIEDIEGGDSIQQMTAAPEKKSGGLLGLLSIIGLASLGKIFSGLFGKIKSLQLTKRIFSVFSKIGKMFGVIGKYFGKTGSFLGKILSPLSRIIRNMPLSRFIGTISGVIGKVLKFFKVIGRVLGKLFLPVTIIMALVQSVIGAFEGYKTGGVMGAIKGGLKGLLDSLIGWLIDIPKDIISWILNAFGFENASKWLDSWNFASLFDGLWEMFSNLWDQIISAISAVTGWWESWSFDGVWQSIKDFFFGIWDNIIGWLQGVGDQLTGVFGNAADFLNDFYKSILREILPNRSVKREWYDPIGMVSMAIPDSVYDWANSPSAAAVKPQNIQPTASMNGGNLNALGGGASVTIINVDQSRGPTSTNVTAINQAPKGQNLGSYAGGHMIRGGY